MTELVHFISEIVKLCTKLFILLLQYMCTCIHTLVHCTPRMYMYIVKHVGTIEVHV